MLGHPGEIDMKKYTSSQAERRTLMGNVQQVSCDENRTVGNVCNHFHVNNIFTGEIFLNTDIASPSMRENIHQFLSL